MKWFKATFSRIKGWLVSVGIALGLIVAGVALAQAKTFTWTNPAFNEDGTAFDAATDLQETRIYCGVDPSAFAPESPGNAQSESPTVTVQGIAETGVSDFSVGAHTCFATSLSVYGYESQPSNSVTFTVTPTVAPEAITDFGVTP